MEFNGDAPPQITSLAKILGISNEAATTLIVEGHVILAEGKKHTFLRLHDMFRSLRKNAAGRA